MPTDPISYEMLADSPVFSEFAANILSLIHLPVGLYAPDTFEEKFFFSMADMNPLCQLIRQQPDGLACCHTDERQRFACLRDATRSLQVRCHAGLVDFAVPIRHRGALIAIISSGQLLPVPPSSKGVQPFYRLARRFGIPRTAIREAYFRAPYLADGEVEAYLRLLTLMGEHLCEMTHQMRQLEDIGRGNVVALARHYIDNHLEEDLSLGQVAAYVDLSPGYFSECFHQATGVSFTDYVQGERIRQAEGLLVSSPQRVTEVAYACGFNSISQFNRTFKKVRGCTPREYRQQQLLQPPIHHTTVE